VSGGTGTCAAASVANANAQAASSATATLRARLGMLCMRDAMHGIRMGDHLAGAVSNCTVGGFEISFSFSTVKLGFSL